MTRDQEPGTPEQVEPAHLYKLLAERLPETEPPYDVGGGLARLMTWAASQPPAAVNADKAADQPKAAGPDERAVGRFAAFPELHITVDPLPDQALRVRVAGEVTLENVSQLRTVLQRAVDDVQATAIEVDLSLVTFIDSTGIGKLVGASAHARNNGSDLYVVNPSPGVRRVLSLLGLLDVLTKPTRVERRAGWGHGAA